MDELSLSDYVAIFNRHKKYFFLTFAVVSAVVVVFALSWSNYRSTATVEIDQPVIATDMTTVGASGSSSTPDALADLRIDKIEQKVTAPSTLVEIITKFNLYADARRYTSMATLAMKMHDKIKMTLISSEIANPAAQTKVSADQLSAIAFTLSFDYNDPQLTQQVTDDLVTRFLDEDLKERRAQAHETSQFLDAQIKALEASMSEQEKKIADFQSAHGGSRPADLMFNQQAAASITMNLEQLDSQLTQNEGNQGSLRAQLASVDPYSRVIADGQVLTTPKIQLKALQANYATLTAQYGPDHPDVIKARHQIESLKAQINSTKGASEPKTSERVGELKSQIISVQTNLAGAEQTRGADNPDVVALRKELANLQDQLDEEKAKGITDTTDALKSDADNPAYLELSIQLKAMEQQYKSLKAQRDTLSAQLAKVQMAVAQNPGLEQQMAALTRDYDNSQLRYRGLKEKKMAADMEEQMEEDKKGQRLVVINPPELPVKTHPSRLLLLLGGFFAAAAAGVGVVFLIQLMSSSIVGPLSVTSLVGVAPMVTVPYIVTDFELYMKHRMRPWYFGGVALVAVIGVIVFHIVIMPLDVLFSVVMQRIGLS